MGPTGAIDMYAKSVRGFTLIELMIVVAIIAILAAIALPAYQDYVVRSQVAEGINLSVAAKNGVWDYYSQYGTLPADNADAGVVASNLIKGKYVADVNIAAGKVTVTYGNDVNDVLLAKTLLVSPMTSPGSIDWICRSTDIDNRFLPANCRTP